jgi:hypothetical protein
MVKDLCVNEILQMLDRATDENKYGIAEEIYIRASVKELLAALRSMEQFYPRALLIEVLRQGRAKHAIPMRYQFFVNWSRVLMRQSEGMPSILCKISVIEALLRYCFGAFSETSRPREYGRFLQEHWVSWDTALQYQH